MGYIRVKSDEYKGKVVHPDHSKNDIRTQILDRSGNIKRIIPIKKR